MGHREAEPRGCRLALHLVGGGSVPAAGGNRPLHLGMEGHLVSWAAGGGGGHTWDSAGSFPTTGRVHTARALAHQRPAPKLGSEPSSITHHGCLRPLLTALPHPMLWILSPAAAGLLLPTARRPGPGSAAQFGTRSGPAQPRGAPTPSSVTHPGGISLGPGPEQGEARSTGDPDPGIEG